MDARTHPRTRISVPVELHCTRRDRYHSRKTGDISPGGLFISGSPCGATGSEFEVLVPCEGSGDPLCLNARIARVAPDGFGMQFTGASPGQLRLLEQVIQPNWDGKDPFEGLMIFAAREPVVDLAGWLRLTSLVCGEYQRCALAHARSGARLEPTGR